MLQEKSLEEIKLLASLIKQIIATKKEKKKKTGDEWRKLLFEP